MRTLSSLIRFAAATALLVAVALLLVSRPALPTAAAFSGTHRLDDVLIFVAWLGGLLLAVGLLYRVAAPKRHASPLFMPPIRHLHPNPGAKPAAAGVYPDQAFPLILKRPQAPPEHSLDEPQLEPAHDGRSAPGVEVSPMPAEAGALISLLGPLTISGGRKHIRRLRGPTKELLAYLALHPSGAHRDQIIDALWPDHAPDQGRNRLWRAAADARSHFADTIVLRDGDHYQLDRTQIAVDLDHLDQLLAELEHAEHVEDELPILEQALALLNGEPLAGSDFPWAENEQRRLHAVQLDLLERAGRACLTLGDPPGALAHAEAGLAHEPYNEQLARLAMEAEAALGLRSAVISRYEQLTQLLSEQLGLQPHQQTRRLFRMLLGQDQTRGDHTVSRVRT
jgi:DNA-binding SARP family transcriptional activator